ncbi:MAG: NIPSNAP family protein [Opitutaceae bacterium]|nr:NIPSNAP family protein [Opitutaceae bacterium]
MKKFLCLPLALAALGAVPFASAAAHAGPAYELRTYHVLPGRMPAMLARFRDHTVKLFERHGMVNVGYWTPADEKAGEGAKLIYLLEHKSREAATASWKAFGADPQWQDVRKKSEADGKIVAKVESLFLTATDYSKLMTAGHGRGAPRAFELRTYVAAEGKLADLDARFRNHTLALFAKHGMTNLAYFHPADADKGAATTLVYFLAHANREAATASWKGFREDPEWLKARDASEKNGKLAAKVESVFLQAVDFSALK